MTSFMTPALLEQSGNMIQDHIQVVDMPLNKNLQNCFQAVQNGPTNNELIGLNPANNLTWFYPDTNSQSGWTPRRSYCRWRAYRYYNE